MSYKTVITTLGLAKIADAIANSTPLTLSTMKLGDGNGNPITNPSPSTTSLVRQVWSGSLSYLNVADASNRFIAEAVVPANVGGWTVREVGIYDNLGNLIAYSNFPEIYKPSASEGASRDLIVRVYFEVTNGDAISIVFDPSVVTASRSWVQANFSLAALLPGGTTGQVLRKHSNADGDVEWFDPTTGLNVIVDVIEEEQTLSDAQTIVNLAVAGTDGASYYVEGVRLHPGDYSVNSATRITLASSYPAGSKILICQNDPGTGFQFLRTANNLSDVPNKSTARENLELLTDSTYLDALWKLMNQRQYPVGELYITRQSGNPSTILGFGTWVRYASGRTLVSLDPGDAAFNAIDLTGGEKTHVLTVGELPAHTHSIDPPSTTTSSSGAHRHFIAADEEIAGEMNDVSSLTNSNYMAKADDRFGVTTWEYALSGSTKDATLALTSSTGDHTHTLDISAFDSASTGGGSAHNNMQPYIVVNIWKRTA